MTYYKTNIVLGSEEKEDVKEEIDLIHKRSPLPPVLVDLIKNEHLIFGDYITFIGGVSTVSMLKPRAEFIVLDYNDTFKELKFNPRFHFVDNATVVNRLIELRHQRLVNGYCNIEELYVIVDDLAQFKGIDYHKLEMQGIETDTHFLAYSNKRIDDLPNYINNQLFYRGMVYKVAQQEYNTRAYRIKPQG